MNNFLKKAFFAAGIVCVLAGGFGRGQNIPECTTDAQCIQKMGANGKCIDGICANIESIAVTSTCKVKDSNNKCCSSSKTYYDSDQNKNVCCEGVLLNTNVPFIGQCITLVKGNTATTPSNGTIVTETTAFPVLMGGLTKMMVSIILMISFVAILVGGVMISASGGSDGNASKGRKLIGNVVVALALLGTSGVILRLINPNFFK